MIKEAIRIAKKTVIINEMLPSFASYAGDIILNKLTHPTMEVPLTLRSTENWMKDLKKTACHREKV